MSVALSNHSVRAVLFDKDGTLLDFNATFGPATEEVIDELCRGAGRTTQALDGALGFQRAERAFAPDSVLIAGSLANIAAVCAPLLGEPMSEDLTHRIDLLYRSATARSLAAFAGTGPALDALAAAGLPLGIATNDTEETAREHVRLLSMHDRFALILGADSGHGEKPGPGMIEAFADHCRLPCSAIAMVGDSDRDLLAARAAGAIAIAVTSGHATRDRLAPLADHVISGIADLPALIARLNGT